MWIKTRLYQIIAGTETAAGKQLNLPEGGPAPGLFQLLLLMKVKEAAEEEKAFFTWILGNQRSMLRAMGRVWRLISHRQVTHCAALFLSFLSLLNDFQMCHWLGGIWFYTNVYLTSQWIFGHTYLHKYLSLLCRCTAVQCPERTGKSQAHMLPKPGDASLFSSRCPCQCHVMCVISSFQLCVAVYLR